MKVYFRYDSGFVNIDSENIYLNNSGNWTDARKAEEKSKRTERKNSWRINKNKSLIYLSITAFIVAFIYSLNKQFGSLGGLMLLLALVVKVYTYLSPDLGKKLKIPIHKIQFIEEKDGVFELNFRDAEGRLEKEVITGAEPEGKLALMNLRLSIVSLDNQLTL